MQLVATASKEVRNKNIILVALCAVFTVLFVYDGWIGWPEANNAFVKEVKEKYAPKIDEYSRTQAGGGAKEVFDNWKGWNHATDAEQDLVSGMKTATSVPPAVHTRLDILTQKLIAGGLILATSAAVWRLMRCQKRRVRADDDGIAPEPGQWVRWDAIKKVDNTAWKKSGKVYITYIDSTGAERVSLLDDYHLDGLRPILQLVADKATQAEFIAPPGEGAEGASATEPPPAAEQDKPKA
jgi:hypothetical protein